jgi:hypothetical protein
LRQKPLKLAGFHKIYEQISTTFLLRQTTVIKKLVKKWKKHHYRQKRNLAKK